MDILWQTLASVGWLIVAALTFHVVNQHTRLKQAEKEIDDLQNNYNTEREHVASLVLMMEFYLDEIPNLIRDQRSRELIKKKVAKMIRTAHNFPPESTDSQL